MRFNKKELISIIQKTEPYKKPKLKLEQYCIDAKCAVDIIYFAGFEFNDITNKIIFDLGAGTGRLSIASAFFNPYLVLSIDIDWNALQILKTNLKNIRLQSPVFPLCTDINHFELRKNSLIQNIAITSIMNPPFGVKTSKADRIFLEKAFSFSDVVYSIHLANNKVHNFISNYIKKFNWIIDYILPFNITLEKSFEFHKQFKKKIEVNIYRFIKIK